VARRNLEQLLKDGAKNWAQRYTILARAKAPRHIAPHITTKSTVSGDGQVVLRSSIKVVDLPNYGTMDAVAQEYGYPGATIVPKTKPMLVFYWEVAGRVVKMGKVTRDPMEAFNDGQGYLRPAAKEWTQEIMASSSRFKDAIRLDILDSFNKITKAALSK
jgi:hypothetical protein